MMPSPLPAPRGPTVKSLIVESCVDAPSSQGHLCGFHGNSCLRWEQETSLDAECEDGPAALLEMQGHGCNNNKLS